MLESTAGLERQVLRALVSAEMAVAMVNPRQVRDFAKATGELAKTDSIDAAVLAHYASDALVHHPAGLAAQVLLIFRQVSS